MSLPATKIEDNASERKKLMSSVSFCLLLSSSIFDEKFHVDLFVQSDTAYLHKQQLWELRGRVVVRNVNGDVFRTEELFWDLNKHEMWNYQYMHITTPERELEGTHFYSNEQMTKYSVLNSTGTFPVQETEPANR